jgi:hypothetical protein
VQSSQADCSVSMKRVLKTKTYNAFVVIWRMNVHVEQPESAYCDEDLGHQILCCIW